MNHGELPTIFFKDKHPLVFLKKQTKTIFGVERRFGYWEGVEPHGVIPVQMAGTTWNVREGKWQWKNQKTKAQYIQVPRVCHPVNDGVEVPSPTVVDLAGILYTTEEWMDGWMDGIIR